MTEEEARSECAAIAGTALPLIERYADLLVLENSRQNMISRSTEVELWSRHLLDSLQLAGFARDSDQTWIDVGSGPGLPGIVLAALGRWNVVLVEPRRRRAEFLLSVIDELRLANASVQMCDVVTVRGRADVISARAVAPLDRIFAWTRGCASEATRFILPKGRSASHDVDLARQRWQGSFHVEQSITNAEAGIVIADGVRPR